ARERQHEPIRIEVAEQGERIKVYPFSWPILGLLLGLARPTAAAFAFALPAQLSAQPAQGIENMLVDVLEDMKDAQLVSCLGPNLGQHGGIEVRAIGDHNLGRETPVLEVVQEA